MVTSCIAGQSYDVLADPDLLALEFEAIVAANYPPPSDGPARTPPPVRRAAATRLPSARRTGAGRRRSSPVRRGRGATTSRAAARPARRVSVASDLNLRAEEVDRSHRGCPRHPHLDPRATSADTLRPPSRPTGAPSG